MQRTQCGHSALEFRKEVARTFASGVTAAPLFLIPAVNLPLRFLIPAVFLPLRPVVFIPLCFLIPAVNLPLASLCNIPERSASGLLTASVSQTSGQPTASSSIDCFAQRYARSIAAVSGSLVVVGSGPPPCSAMSDSEVQSEVSREGGPDDAPEWTFFEHESCPVADECNTANFKKWKVWGWTVAEAQKQLIAHLSLSGCHHRDLSEEEMNHWIGTCVESVEVKVRTMKNPHYKSAGKSAGKGLKSPTRGSKKQRLANAAAGSGGASSSSTSAVVV